MIDEQGLPYQYCIVGNIIGAHYFGVEKEIKSGTKHFRAGTKVYCIFMYGGMGHERIMVLGKPRKSFRMVEVILDRKYIKNFRVQKVYAPRIIAFINKHPHLAIDDKEDIEWFEFYNLDTNAEIKLDE